MTLALEVRDRQPGCGYCVSKATASGRRHLAAVAVDASRDEALALSAEDREELAAALLDSLRPDPNADRAGVDQAWTAELERRVAALDSGEDLGVSSEDTVAKACLSLAD